MKILLLSTVPLQPRSDGKRVMLGGIYDYLLESPQVQSIRIFSFAHEGNGGRDIEQSSPVPVWRKLHNVFWHTFIRHNKTIQEGFFWKPSLVKRLQEIETEFAPDVIFFDTLRTGQYRGAFRSSARHLLYMDDLFSLRYERMLASMKEGIGDGLGVIGNFAGHIPKFLLIFYRVIPWLQRLLLKTEACLMREAEDKAPKQFGECILISKRETELLVERTGATNIVAMPPRVASSKTLQRSWSGRPVFVFLGALNVAHNSVAVEQFITEVLPAAKAKIQGLKIRVIGKGASSKLKALAEANANHVELVGYVDSLEEELASCCGMILPLNFGTGVKIKIIDALRCGVPLLGTSIAFEGIEAAESPGIKIVRDLDEFPQAMEQCLNPDTNQLQSKANRRLFSERYAPSVLSAQYDKIFGLETPARVVRAACLT